MNDPSSSPSPPLDSVGERPEGEADEHAPTARRAAVALGVAVAAIGCLALAGWAVDTAWLKRLRPGLVTMKANTAASLVLAGAGVAFLAGRSARRRHLAAACGSAVLLIGGVTLAEYVLGWGPGIDQLLFRENPDPLLTPFPGRMAVQAAAALTLLGLSPIFLSRDARRLRRVGEIAAVLTGLVGFQALVGHAYGVEILYDLPRSSSVAVHTALSLIMVALASLLARPDDGAMAPFLAAHAGSAMARRLLPAAVALPFVAGLLALIGQGRGFYPSQVTASLIVTGVTVLLLLYTWWAAGRAGSLDAERRRAERAYRDEAEIVRTLNEVGGLLTQQLDRPKLLQAITETATQQTGAAFGAFLFGTEQDADERYTFHAGSGVTEEWLAGFPPPREARLSRATLRTGSTVRLFDLTRDPSYRRLLPRDGPSLRGQAVRSYMAVPISSTRGEVIGGLFFGHPEPGAFTATHERLAVGIAAWAGIALENAELYEDLRRAVTNRQEILSVVSHDMRNALHAVACATEALDVLAPEPPAASEPRERLRRPDGSRAPERSNGGARQALRIVRGSVKQMARLIQDLLDVEAIDSGRLRLEPSEGSVRRWVRDAVSMIEPVARRHGVRLEVSAPARNDVVLADRDRFVQVLSNLLDNAIEFGPRGGRVTVRIEGTNEEVRVSVTDEGRGIAPHDLARVFEPFWTGSGRQGTGAGLGLSIARAIVEAHGGRIWAESREGKGTSFYFALPRETVRDASASGAGRRASAMGRTARASEEETETGTRRPRARESPRP